MEQSETGEIDMEAFRRALSHIRGGAVSDEEIRILFEALDKNGDQLLQHDEYNIHFKQRR